MDFAEFAEFGSLFASMSALVSYTYVRTIVVDYLVGIMNSYGLLSADDCTYAYRDAFYEFAAVRRGDDSEYGSVRGISPHPCYPSIYSSGD